MCFMYILLVSAIFYMKFVQIRNVDVINISCSSCKNLNDYFQQLKQRCVLKVTEEIRKCNVLKTIVADTVFKGELHPNQKLACLHSISNLSAPFLKNNICIL